MNSSTTFKQRKVLPLESVPRRSSGTIQQRHSGLGNLVATDWQAIGTLYRNAEEYVIDPLGNVIRTRTADGLNGFDAKGSEPRRNLYQEGQARIIETAKVPPAIINTSFNQDSTIQSYDDPGNLSYVYRVASTDNTTGAGTVSETRHYYGGDERLRALQRVSYSRDSNMAIRQGGVWEEYRYDPLGRRVLVRTRTDGNLCDVDMWTCTGSITRFVWAGDQILWELRAPGNGGTDANLEATDGGGNAYGRVSYSYAGGIDRPLVITKEAVSTVIPHRNWRGMFANATTTTGALSQVPVDWPGFETTPWHKTRSSVQNWFGSVATGMRDASEQIYMRNRYYNPATGQFTQPDPIGLAGGLNSYGFAAGDPVGNWDPSGSAHGEWALIRLWGVAPRWIAAWPPRTERRLDGWMQLSGGR